MNKKMLIFDPLEQFEIINISGNWFPNNCPSKITNLLLSPIYADLLFIFINAMLVYKTNIGNIILDKIYFLVKDIVKTNTSLKRNQYFSVIFYLFIYIFIANIFGLIPYTFTITSSFIFTLFISLIHFSGINIIGIAKQKWTIGNLFSGGGSVPLKILPFLTIIELISYIARVLSLSIRLFANMMAGHALLKILISFAWDLAIPNTIFSTFAIITWFLVLIILFLEILISFLQAYVFTVLTTIYIQDSISNQH